MTEVLGGGAPCPWSPAGRLQSRGWIWQQTKEVHQGRTCFPPPPWSITVRGRGALPGGGGGLEMRALGPESGGQSALGSPCGTMGGSPSPAPVHLPGSGPGQTPTITQQCSRAEDAVCP